MKKFSQFVTFSVFTDTMFIFCNVNFSWIWVFQKQLSLIFSKFPKSNEFLVFPKKCHKKCGKEFLNKKILIHTQSVVNLPTSVNLKKLLNFSQINFFVYSKLPNFSEDWRSSTASVAFHSKFATVSSCKTFKFRTVQTSASEAVFYQLASLRKKWSLWIDDFPSIFRYGEKITKIRLSVCWFQPSLLVKTRFKQKTHQYAFYSTSANFSHFFQILGFFLKTLSLGCKKKHLRVIYLFVQFLHQLWCFFPILDNFVFILEPSFYSD